MTQKLIIEPTPTDANNRLCVQVFDNDDKLVQRSYGRTPAEKQLDHDNHMCDCFCFICYDEAMKSKGEFTCSK